MNPGNKSVSIDFLYKSIPNHQGDVDKVNHIKLGYNFRTTNVELLLKVLQK